MKKSYINGITVGEGTPLVFQHGLTANLGQVEALFGGLKGIRLMAIDCPGHGSSPLPPHFSVSFNRYADEVIDFLDMHNVSKAIFGGISMGSGIALNVALRYPERVMGLFLVRPAWLDQSNPDNLLILLPAAQQLDQADGKARFSALEEFQNLKPNAAAQSVLGVFAPEQQPELAQVIPLMVNDHPFDSIEQLKQINLPTMVIGNDHDPLHPYAMAEKISQSIAGSVLRKVTSRYIDNAKHSEQLRAALNDFIKDNSL